METSLEDEEYSTAWLGVWSATASGQEAGESGLVFASGWVPGDDSTLPQTQPGEQLASASVRCHLPRDAACGPSSISGHSGGGGLPLTSTWEGSPEQNGL